FPESALYSTARRPSCQNPYRVATSVNRRFCGDSAGDSTARTRHGVSHNTPRQQRCTRSRKLWTANGATSPSMVLPAKDLKPPRAALHAESREGPLRRRLSHPGSRGRTADVRFESGPCQSIIDDGDF